MLRLNALSFNNTKCVTLADKRFSELKDMKALKTKTAYYITMTVAATIVVSLPFLIPSLIKSNDNYRLYSKTSIEELRQRARIHARMPEGSDSAIYYNTLCAAKYTSDAPDSIKAICAGAYCDIGYLQFFRYNNYPAAMNSLLEGVRIAEETEDLACLPHLNMYLGNIYSRYGETSISLDYYRKAFYGSISKNDHYTASLALGNIIFSSPELSSLNDEIKAFDKMTDGITQEKHSALTNAIACTINAKKESERGNYAQSLYWLDKASSIMKTSNGRVTVNEIIANIKLLKSDIYEKTGKTSMAIDTLVSILNESSSSIPVKMDISLAIAKVYDRAANPDSAYKYFALNSALRDSLFKNQSYRDIITTFETESLNKEIVSINRSKHKLMVGFWVSITVIAVICLIVYALRRHNRILAGKNRDLFWRYTEIIRQQEFHNRQKEQYEKELAQLREEIGKSATTSDVSDRKKYEKSILTEQEKFTIAENIKKIFTENPEITSEGFSLARLSCLVCSDSKRVSQVMNEVLGKNFYTLLAEARIRLACQCLIDTEHYGHLTIEAIAAETGFKSRSNFVKTFKSVIGMTPSEFKKIGASQSTL